jgi:hypothetical protein
MKDINTFLWKELVSEFQQSGQSSNIVVADDEDAVVTRSSDRIAERLQQRSTLAEFLSLAMYVYSYCKLKLFAELY